MIIQHPYSGTKLQRGHPFEAYGYESDDPAEPGIAVCRCGKEFEFEHGDETDECKECRGGNTSGQTPAAERTDDEKQ